MVNRLLKLIDGTLHHKYAQLVVSTVEKTLDIINWTCECGAEHDRDINASKNIKNEGLRKIQSFEKVG